MGQVCPAGSGGGGGASGPYRVKQVMGDYLVCVSWDGTTEGTDDVYIAKEWKHRNSLTGETILGEAHTYTYEADADDPDGLNVIRHDEVAATSTTTDERLVPPWVQDEEIMAVAAKTGVTTEDGTDVALLVTGRSGQWAEKS